jgi:hypothetical protein
MTEAEWLASTDPEQMLEFLTPRADERKLRLFVCACCRRIWPLLTEEVSRRAVEVAEQYADGRAGVLELALVRTEAIRAAGAGPVAAYWTASRNVAKCTWNVLTGATGAAARAARKRARETGADELAAYSAALATETKAQVRLLRDLFGNPFRPAPVDPSWLAWKGGAVGQIAQGIYEQRSWGDLPVLADALEEAGCGDLPLLEHLRSAGEHVRGCWGLDLLLNKG